MQMQTDRQTDTSAQAHPGRESQTEGDTERPTERRKAGDGQGTGDGIPSETDTLAQTVTHRRERPVRKGGGVSLGPGEPRLDAVPWGWQSPVGTPRLPRSRGLKGPLRLGSLRRDPAPAPRPEGECGRERACECVGGRRWGRVDWGGRVDTHSGGGRVWRPGLWKPVRSSCCLSLSPSFSVSLTCGFRLLTCLGCGGCVCVWGGGREGVCVCVCVCVCVLCARACGRPRGCLPGCVWGWGWGPGPAQNCLRPAKGAPDRDPRASAPAVPLVSWTPKESRGAGGPRGGNPGLQRESGAPATRPERGWKAGGGSERGGVPGASGRCGLRCGWGRGLKERGGREKQKQQKAYSTRYSQAVSHPSTNRARPCLASEIRRDRARSGWYGRRRRRLPPGALRALRCACLSL